MNGADGKKHRYLSDQGGRHKEVSLTWMVRHRWTVGEGWGGSIILGGEAEQVGKALKSAVCGVAD